MPSGYTVPKSFKMDIEPFVGHLIGHSYNAGYILLSYFVSFSGAWTALELLHRRTSARGLYNWYLLLAAASAMGAVAIWSMHFIGNRAIVMGHGEAQLQIEYSPGYTAGSFFLPICVVGAAFYFFSIAEKVSVFATLVGGFLTGAAVCGMHYTGQGGISNYAPIYAWAYVLGSALIAVAASTVALGVFFYLKSTWTNSWAKRMACAVLLAISVSGMHWVATVGTTYRLKVVTGSSTDGLSRTATVIVVLCLALGCCTALFSLALIGQWSRKRAADRAQQVVLACATFDPEGRIMVTTEGLLPCRKITNSYFEHSFDDIFNLDHPVFCWIYRASRSWPGIRDLIPAIRGSVRGHGTPKSSRPGTSSPATFQRKSSSAEETEDYTLYFKQLFLAAAGDLADAIQESIENIGVLFEDIMNTGTLKKTGKKLFKRARTPNALDEVERGSSSSDIFGRGQLLFLVRRATRQECTRIQAAGYRFATLSNVIEFLARSMEVTQKELLPRLERMQAQAGKNHMLDPGIHLGFFAIRPVLAPKGFQILAKSDAKNLIPTVKLPLLNLGEWHLDMFKQLNNLTVSECLSEITSKMNDMSDAELEFLEMLRQGIHELFKHIPQGLSAEARLIARPARAPCRGMDTNPKTGSAFVVSFHTIADVHSTLALDQGFEFVPSRLFLCQQRCFRNAPDNDAFARRVHREFTDTIEAHGLKYTSSVGSRNRSSSRAGLTDIQAGRLNTPAASPTTTTTTWPAAKSDSSPERKVTDVASAQPFGGIHVSNQVSVDVSSNRPGERSSDIEMMPLPLGNHAEAAVAPLDSDSETWIDRLWTITIQRRRRPAGLSSPGPRN